jgi:1-acylglycerone phosphate reductase
LALELQASGYTVVATARKVSSLEELRAAGLQCEQLDVTAQESIDAAVKNILAVQGRIDVLVNNAGLSRIGPIIEQPLQEFREVLDTNVVGVIQMCQAVVPSMIARGNGLVVNIGSVTSFLTTPWSAAYSASKAALQAVTDSLRLEVAPFGIGVIHATAGAIRSSISENISSGSDLRRYEQPSSYYRPWVESLLKRVTASQGKAAVPAETAALKIRRVIDRAVGQPHHNPPAWFLVGGSAFSYWLLGLLQKVCGWPTNGMLSRMFQLTWRRQSQRSLGQ